MPPFRSGLIDGFVNGPVTEEYPRVHFRNAKLQDAYDRGAAFGRFLRTIERPVYALFLALLTIFIVSVFVMK